MNLFTYKPIYIEEGKRILEMNILPEKYCTFDCTFCPIGRSHHKTDTIVSFPSIEGALADLERHFIEEKPELVFINSRGEALIHNQLPHIIEFIHAHRLPVRLLSNGYLLGKQPYMDIADCCEEVIGELKAVREDDFQLLQRPIEGWTLADYIQNMVAFRHQYKGEFIFEITILRTYTDDDDAIEILAKIIRKLTPHSLKVMPVDDDRFWKRLGVEEKRIKEIEERLQKEMA